MSTLRDELLEAALASFEQFKDKVKNPAVITIIDYSIHSSQKRLFVYDLNKKTVIRSHHVAHGRGSALPADLGKAVMFSNIPNSHMSSLGAAVTGGTYFGTHKLSLKLHGLEEGLNDKMYSRLIVIHASKYVTDAYIDKKGRAGCSWGCPAVDPAICKSLIALIKDGTFVYLGA